MAIDTRDKRLSVLGYGLPCGSPLPTPDALVELGERRTLVDFYRGTIVSVDWTNRASILSVLFSYLRPVGPYPDGGFISRDRQMVAGLYWGLAPGAPVATLFRSHTVARAISRALGRSM